MQSVPCPSQEKKKEKKKKMEYFINHKSEFLEFWLVKSAKKYLLKHWEFQIDHQKEIDASTGIKSKPLLHIFSLCREEEK